MVEVEIAVSRAVAVAVAVVGGRSDETQSTRINLIGGTVRAGRDMPGTLGLGPGTCPDIVWPASHNPNPSTD